MPLFLILFFLIAISAHGCFLWKLRAAFPGATRLMIIAAAFCALMILSPPLGRWLENRGWFWLPRILGWVGWTWLAALFWFALGALAVDLWNLLARIAAWTSPRRPKPPAIPPRASLTALTVVILGCVALAAIEARDVRLRVVHVKLRNYPSDAAPIRLILISDVHISLLRREGLLKRIAARIREARPDILVSVGDLVDGTNWRLNGLSRRLQEIEAPFGKYAVLGNHEHYAGASASLRFTRACGFTTLRGESVSVAPGLRIAGVDNDMSRHFNDTTDNDAAFARAHANEAVILLKHRPFPEPAANGRADLQLSGHTHDGQIWPFSRFVRQLYPVSPGLTRFNDGAAIYLSRGTGTWGPPLRFFAPPEVALLILEPY